MNMLQKVYCYHYQDIVKQGRQPKGDPKSGNMIFALSMVMILIGLLFVGILFFPDFKDVVESMLKGKGSGKSIAFLLVAGLLAPIFLIVHLVGNQNYYQKCIVQYLNLSTEQQAAAAKSGLIFFSLSIAIMVLPIIGLMIQTMM